MSLQLSQVTSASNPQYKVWKSLITAKGIKENSQFLLMGSKLVQEFLLDPADGFKIETLLCTEKVVDIPPHVRQTLLSKDLFKEIDSLGTHSPILVLSFQKFEEADLSLVPQGLEIVTPLGDPRNLGALARSATAFGVSRIILTQEATHPFLPPSVKASAGAVLKMKFTKSKLSLSEIPLVGENYALSLNGRPIEKIKWPKNLRLWVGEEGPGLKVNPSTARQMNFVNIPTHNVESLNAMVSASLAIWEWKKQQ